MDTNSHRPPRRDLEFNTDQRFEGQTHLHNDRNAHSGAVACGHPITADAAREILEEGGNAFDAAVAAVCAACVAEPVLASLAGGGHLLAHEAGAAAVVYDFFVNTPLKRGEAGAIDLYPFQADFGEATQEFHIGLGTAATPGVIGGLFDVHGDLGRLPIDRLFEPAVRAAREGVLINPFQAYLFQVIAPVYVATSGARANYGADRAALPASGQRFRQPDLGNTLEWLARKGPDGFYRGDLGELLITDCAANGGQLTREDLQEYRVIRRVPLALDYRDSRIYTNPLPSTGGTLIGFALSLLDCISDAESAQWLPAIAETMKLTNRARLEGAGSPLDQTLLERYRREMTAHATCNRGTTHISIIDAQGNLAAVTLSNGEGCGHVLPGTGIMLNNMLGEEDINPGGLQKWTPGTRMASMMAPTLIERDGTRAVLGSGGSNRIRSAILQVLTNLVDLGMSPDDAVNAPRIHVEGDLLSFEEGFTPSEEAALKRTGLRLDRWKGRNLFFGGVHLVNLGDTGLGAVGDPRRGGVGVVLE